MNTVLVWLLVSINGANVVSYSPPLADLETCQRLNTEMTRYLYAVKCIQVKVLK